MRMRHLFQTFHLSSKRKHNSYSNDSSSTYPRQFGDENTWGISIFFPGLYHVSNHNIFHIKKFMSGPKCLKLALRESK